MNNIMTTQYMKWVISLGAISYLGLYTTQFMDVQDINNLDNHLERLVQGVPVSKTKLFEKRVDIFYQDRMLKKNRMSLMNRLNTLLKPDSEEIQIVNEVWMNEMLNESKIDKKTPRKEKEYKEYLKQNSSFWSRDAYYAYNLANAVSLLQVSYNRQQINHKTFVDYLNRIGQIVEHDFENYYDFGKKAALAYGYDHYRIQRYEKVKNHYYDSDRLSYGVYKFWKNIPWAGGMTYEMSNM